MLLFNESVHKEYFFPEILCHHSHRYELELENMETHGEVNLSDLYFPFVVLKMQALTNKGKNYITNGF